MKIKIDLSQMLLALALMYFIFCIFLLYFLYRQTNINHVKAEEINLEWQIQSSKHNELLSLEKGVKAVDPERIELNKHFIKINDIVPFLDTIETLAPKVGAEASTTSVELSSDKIALLVGLNTEGSFQSIYKFITLLENSPYELEFTSVKITKYDTTWRALFIIKLLSFSN